MFVIHLSVMKSADGLDPLVVNICYKKAFCLPSLVYQELPLDPLETMKVMWSKASKP